jgi:hypothetical protein
LPSAFSERTKDVLNDTCDQAWRNSLCHERSKRRSESLRRQPCRFWEPQGCPCSQAVPRRQPLERPQPNRRHRTSRLVKQPFLAKRKSPTSIWRPSMCSTRKVLECRRAACNSPEEAAAVAGAAAVAEAAVEDAALAAEAVASVAEGAVAPAACRGAPAAGASIFGSCRQLQFVLAGPAASNRLRTVARTAAYRNQWGSGATKIRRSLIEKRGR